MITHLHVENFKSLVDFDLPPLQRNLGAFTCLIGLNDSGKSTVLQAFDFAAQVATGSVGAWLTSRDWKKSELGSFLPPKKSSILFTITFQTLTNDKIEWCARFNVNDLRCTTETIKFGETEVLQLEKGQLSV